MSNRVALSRSESDHNLCERYFHSKSNSSPSWLGSPWITIDKVANSISGCHCWICAVLLSVVTLTSRTVFLRHSLLWFIAPFSITESVRSGDSVCSVAVWLCGTVSMLILWSVWTQEKKSESQTLSDSLRVLVTRSHSVSQWDTRTRAWDLAEYCRVLGVKVVVKPPTVVNEISVKLTQSNMNGRRKFPSRPASDACTLWIVIPEFGFLETNLSFAISHAVATLCSVITNLTDSHNESHIWWSDGDISVKPEFNQDSDLWWFTGESTERQVCKVL